MKLYDGKRAVEITMCQWNGSGYTPDWANDFFEAGGLKYDDVKDWHIVQDVQYCIDQANDCINHQGDFACDEPINENDCVFVDEIEIN